jgi:O-antigen ligase
MSIIIAILAVIIIPLAIFRYPVLSLALFLTTASLKTFLLYRVSFFQRVDYTVLCASMLLIAMAFDFVKKGGQLKNIINIPLGVFLALVALMFFGLTYTSAPNYGFQKSTRFATFGLIAFLAPIVFTHNFKDIRSIIRMLLAVGIIVAVGTIMAKDVMLGIPSQTGFLESDVLGTGETIGTAAIIAFIFAIMTNTPKPLKIISIALMPVLVLAIILTGGRGPLMGLVFIWLVTMLVCRRGTSKVWQLFIIGAIVITLMLSFVKLPEEITGRISNLWAGSYEREQAVRSRTDLFFWATERFHERPILGHGTGAFAVDWGGQDIRLYPHNILIESIYEQGLAGGVTLSLFLWLIFRRWRKASKLIPLYELDTGIFQTVHTVGLLFLFALIQAMKSGDLDGNRPTFFGAGLVVAVFRLVYHRVEEISAENAPGVDGYQQLEEADFQETPLLY